MKYGLTILLLIFLPSKAVCTEFNFGLGVGHTYGGIFGTQYSLVDDSSKYRFHLGMLGAGLGYEYRYSSNSSLGLTAAVHYPFGPLASVDWAYYSSGEYMEGFTVSISLVRSKFFPPPGVASNSSGNNADNDPDRYATYFWFSLGYQF